MTHDGSVSLHKIKAVWLIHRTGPAQPEMDRTLVPAGRYLPFSGDLPAVDDLGGSGHRAEIAHASSASSTASPAPKGGGRKRSKSSTSQTAHGCHVTHGAHVTHVAHVAHGAHGAKRTKA